MRARAASNTEEKIKNVLRTKEGRAVRVCSVYERIGSRAHMTNVMIAVGTEAWVLIADGRVQSIMSARLKTS